MIKSLYIKDYAIISELNIDFNSGFNVFTGETGAGKSIIVGALSLLIKGKADPGVIKTGANKAIVEGVFTIDDYMKQYLDEADIEYDDEIIIRRVISLDNHNSIRINQNQVTLNFLINLFNNHIDIHSQKDSQFLLDKKNHLYLLDKYCNDNDLLNNYQNKYQEYLNIKNEYNDLINNTYNEAELDYLQFDLNELESAKLSVEEENDLIDKERIYKSSEKYLNSLNNAINYYDKENGVEDNISSLIKELNIDDEKIMKAKDNIETLFYSLKDEIDNLKDVLNMISSDDINIEYIEERLYLYSKLKRKHNLDTEGLINKKKQIQERINFFNDKEFILNNKKKQLDDIYNEVLTIANNIHDLRQKNASKLEKMIVKECDELVLKDVNFKINIDQVGLNSNGVDDVEFFISLNKGESLKPLKNIASGGEISRLMLALKSIFTSLSDTSLIVFDEIDTGISGKIALVVGQKIAKIAKDTQVLCITHLAPVAACGDHHYYIYKDSDTDTTSSNIKEIFGDDIINELAFISSADNSDSSIKAARELYKQAQESIK